MRNSESNIDYEMATELLKNGNATVSKQGTNLIFACYGCPVYLIYDNSENLIKIP